MNACIIALYVVVVSVWDSVDIICLILGYPQQSDDNDSTRLALLAAALRRSQSTGDLDLDKSDDEPEFPFIDLDQHNHCSDEAEPLQQNSNTKSLTKSDPWIYSADIEDGQETPSEGVSEGWAKTPMLSTSENSGLLAPKPSSSSGASSINHGPDTFDSKKQDWDFLVEQSLTFLSSSDQGLDSFVNFQLKCSC